MAGLSGTFGDVEVVTLYDMFPKDIKDVDFIERLSQTGQWCIVSIDRFTKHHNAEREALRRGGHIVFVLEKQWSTQPYWIKAERLVKWWPQIVAQAKILESGMLSVPFAHRASAKFKQIRL